MNYGKLAELLLPNILKNTEYYEKLYPKRELANGAIVTRFAPSPTSDNIHIGNLYVSLASERLSHQSNGIFYLRIEDTDNKREVKGATNNIVTSLKDYGINFDEGATIDGQNGDYGNYYQSNRVEIYQTYVKDLIRKGLAYPCFLTSEELEDIRSKQEELKSNYGIYGDWAIYRNLSYDEIKSKIDADIPYVIRLKSDGNLELPKEQIKMISVEDGIRGTLTMPENNQDVVILKTNGVPTYHFAHAIDDHLMRTTHVIRGAEWLPSLPIHIELFNKLGFEIPTYCHTAQLMKIDETGSKRKLSKRKDPELTMSFYKEMGYHPIAVKEYLMVLLNSNFEEWRIENPTLPLEDFKFNINKMGNSGALFDINKLEDVSKTVLSKLSAEEIYEFVLDWAKDNNEKAYELLLKDKDYACNAINIGRIGDKPRKDLIYAKQIFEFISYFYDECFIIPDEKPSKIEKEDSIIILHEYKNSYNHTDEQPQWFERIKEICVKLNYAVRPKDYKKNPEQYNGHIGDVSEWIRFAITGRTQSPDLWEIQQILGHKKTIERIDNLISITDMCL